MIMFYTAVIDNFDDKKKFELLYNTYKKRMWYAANRILSDEFLAEDAVHEAFIGIAKNIKKIGDIESAQTFAYVITAVKNSAVSLIRKNKISNTVDIDELYELNDVSSELDFNKSEMSDYMERILLQIPEKYRDVLYYLLVEEMSEKEIAVLLSRNINTVRQQVRRGKAMIAEKMKKEGVIN